MFTVHMYRGFTCWMNAALRGIFLFLSIGYGLIPHLYSQEAQNIEILFKIKNDINLPPMGLLAVIRDSRAIVKASNDLGYTHGVDVEASMVEVGRHSEKRWEIIAVSDLFEMPVDPNQPYSDPKPDHMPVHFTERNIFELKRLLRDLDTGAMISGSVGVMVLNSQALSIGASGQQEVFHNFTRNFNSGQGDYVYLPDGQGVRVSGFIAFALGISDALLSGGAFEIRGSVLEESRLHTLADESTEEIKTDVSIAHEMCGGKLKLKIGNFILFHSQGTQYTPFASLQYVRKRWAIDSSIYFPLGKLQNNVLYNKDPEPYSALGIRYFISR